jgi:hypothetical protein
MQGSTGAPPPPVKKGPHGGRVAPSESPGPGVRRAQCHDDGLCRASAGEDSSPESAGGAGDAVCRCLHHLSDLRAGARVLPPAAPHRILEPIPSPMTAGSSAGAAGFRKQASLSKSKRPGPPTRPLHKFKTLKPHSTRLNATSPALSPTVKLAIFCA